MPGTRRPVPDSSQRLGFLICDGGGVNEPTLQAWGGVVVVAKCQEGLVAHPRPELWKACCHLPL